MIRIAGGDPGKNRDYFAFVIIEVTDKITVKGARQWKKQAYTDIEQKIAKYHTQYDFDHIVIELNNTGEHVVEVLVRQYGLPIVPVTTSKDLKDIKKIAGIKTMDKNEMVGWLSKMFQDNKIVLPIKGSKDMQELKRQINIFAEKRTEAGSISYYAPGSEHDDLVMALMLACFIGRRYMTTENRSKISITSRKIVPESEDLLGTAVPPYATRLHREIHYP